MNNSIGTHSIHGIELFIFIKSYSFYQNWSIFDNFIQILSKTQAFSSKTWWRHQMETFSALLAICAGNSPASGEFPAQRPVTRSFDVFFDLCLNKWLRKQSRGWWFETLSCPLWRHRNENGLLRKRWLFHSGFDELTCAAWMASNLIPFTHPVNL